MEDIKAAGRICLVCYETGFLILALLMLCLFKYPLKGSL